MIQLPLSQGLVALIDERDAHLAEFKWSASVRKDTSYALRNVSGAVLYLHRVVLNVGAGVLVDHRNGDGLDCRRENLRAATNSDNQLNRGKLNANNRSGYPGVSWFARDGKWEVRFCKKFFGLYADLDEAVAVRKAAEIEKVGHLTRMWAA